MKGGVALIFLEAEGSASARKVADGVWAALEEALPHLHVAGGRLFAEGQGIDEVEPLIRRLDELGWASAVPADEPSS